MVRNDTTIRRTNRRYSVGYRHHVAAGPHRGGFDLPRAVARRSGAAAPRDRDGLAHRGAGVPPRLAGAVHLLAGAGLHDRGALGRPALPIRYIVLGTPPLVVPSELRGCAVTVDSFKVSVDKLPLHRQARLTLARLG